MFACCRIFLHLLNCGIGLPCSDNDTGKQRYEYEDKDCHTAYQSRGRGDPYGTRVLRPAENLDVPASETRGVREQTRVTDGGRPALEQRSGYQMSRKGDGPRRSARRCDDQARNPSAFRESLGIHERGSFLIDDG